MIALSGSNKWRRLPRIGVVSPPAEGAEYVVSSGLARVAARAQQAARVRLIGAIPLGPSYGKAFRESLDKLGWTDGRNIRIEFRYVSGDTSRIRADVAELVALAPEVILSAGTETTTALQQTTRAIPIVFVHVADPISAGLVPSLAHPGGNLTGFTSHESSIGGKWLEVLKMSARSAGYRRISATVWVRPLDLRLIPVRSACLILRRVNASHDNQHSCLARCAEIVTGGVTGIGAVLVCAFAAQGFGGFPVSSRRSALPCWQGMTKPEGGPAGMPIEVAALLSLAPWSRDRSGMAEIAGSQPGVEPEHEAVNIVNGKS